MVSADYLVPEIAGTLDQLAARKSRPTNTPRPRHNNQIRTIEDYYDDDTREMFNADGSCQYIDESGKSPHIRSFRDGGDRPPNKRGYDRGRGYGYRNRTYNQTGQGTQKRREFKGQCNAYGLENHHASSYYFLLKLKQALTYLGVDPDTA